MNYAKNVNILSSFNGVLDTLGNIENAVLIFSPMKRLTKHFRDELVEITRSSDYSSRWFGYDKNGDLESGEVSQFLNGSNGLIRQCANQGNNNYKISQLINQNYKPKLFNNGELLTDGGLFDGVDDYLNINDYADIQIINPNLSMYVNTKKIGVNVAYLYAKNYTSFSDSTHRIISLATSQRVNLGYTSGQCDITTGDNTEKTLFAWNSQSSNGIKFKNATYEDIQTCSDTLTNYQYVTIGARSSDAIGNRTSFFNGYIKTFIIFNSDEYNNYSNFVNGGI